MMYWFGRWSPYSLALRERDGRAAGEKLLRERRAAELERAAADERRLAEERDASEASREAMRKEREATESTVDFEGQAMLMATMDGGFGSPMNGSASPSGSDYGF